MPVGIITNVAAVVIGGILGCLLGGRVTERRELRTEAEALTLLTETFGIAVPASFHRFLYRP